MPTARAAPEPTAIATAPVARSATVAASTPTSSSRRLVAYYTGWSVDRDYGVSNVPADKLSHLNYAFASVSATGECVPMSARVDQINLPALRQLKAKHPSLRTSISIGGSTRTSHFSVAAATDAARQRFARSAIAFMKQGGFDGIDVDWEFPTGTAEGQSLTALLAELRRQLDAAGTTDATYYFLTVAAPAGPAHYAPLELGKIHLHVDWLNLMTYAFHGTWSTITNLAAPLYSSPSDPTPIVQRLAYNVNAAVQAYLAAGVPPAKILVGVPFYGSGWKGVPNVNHGLYQPANGIPPGTRDPGIFAYRDLQANYLTTYAREWHEQAKAPWLYNPATGIMISYDDPRSLALKADYVKANRLGGVMIWELSTDTADHALVNALSARLN